jgi:hypothetical protein
MQNLRDCAGVSRFEASRVAGVTDLLTLVAFSNPRMIMKRGFVSNTR